MFRIALKSLLGHKLRMLLTALSIIIGVSFVAGSYIFTDSISAVFDDIFDDAYAAVDVIVKPKSQEFEGSSGSSSSFTKATVPESIVDRLASIDGVEEAVGEASGLAVLVKPNGELATTSGAPSLGFSWVDSPGNPLKIVPGGRAPQAPGEVAIDANTAENNGFSVGDTVDILSTGPVEQFKIVGTMTFGEASSLAGATISVFELSEAQRFFGLGNGYSQVSILSDGSVSPDELKNKIGLVMSNDVEVVTGEQQKSNDLEEINQGLGFLNTALLAFAGIAIFVGGFIIQNTFRIVVAQRSKELALLRAVGATKKQVVRAVIYEALMVAIFASAMGIIAGIGLTYLLITIVDALGIGLPEAPLTVEARTIIVAFAVGISVTVISAIAPAVKASRVSPVEAMRDIEASTPRRSLQKRALLGFIATGIGTAALSFGLFRDIERPYIYVGFGAAMMFIGISIIAPLLSQPFATVIGKPLSAIYGIVGHIAERNAKRSPRRTASTASALMIGVALVVFAAVFASSARVTVDKIVGENFPGDISITSKLIQTDPFGATFPAQASEDIRKLDEVESVSQLKYDFVKLKDPQSGEFPETLIIAIQPETFGGGFNLGNQQPYSRLDRDTVFVKDTELTRIGKSIGDTIDLKYALTGDAQLTISGSFTEAFDSPYVINEATYLENFVNREDLFVVANINDNFTIEKGRDAIARELKAYPTINVQDKNQLVNQARTMISQALNLLTALLGFAILIAILGITNTLTLSVAERTRELGMLRAIGMTRRQVRRMIRVEAIIIAVFGAVLGAIMGIFFGWAILRSLHELGFTAFSLPVAQIVLYIAMAGVAGMLAAIIPSFKASRMNILKAINYE